MSFKPTHKHRINVWRDYGDFIKLAICSDDPESLGSWKETVVITEQIGLPSIKLSEGEVNEPTLVLTPMQATEILQKLWDIGLRPNDGAGSSAQVNAMDNHLQDMRGMNNQLLQAVLRNIIVDEKGVEQ